MVFSHTFRIPHYWPLFGVARSTVCIIVHTTVNAIVNVLLRKYIVFPTGQHLSAVVNDFDTFHNVLELLMAVIYLSVHMLSITLITIIAKAGTSS